MSRTEAMSRIVHLVADPTGNGVDEAMSLYRIHRLTAEEVNAWHESRSLGASAADRYRKRFS